MRRSILELVIITCSCVGGCVPQSPGMPVASGGSTAGPATGGAGPAASGGSGGGGPTIPPGTGGATGGSSAPTRDGGPDNVDGNGADQPPVTPAADAAPADANISTGDGASSATGGGGGGARPDSGAGGMSPASWWDTAWTRRHKVTITDSQGTGELVDFQVPVKLDGASFGYSSARPGGQDLRFVDSAGTVLSHQIDSWDASGTSVAWVKLPKLTAAPTVLWLYSGNAAAGPPADATVRAVWPPPYAGVWHLSGDSKDSTANAFDGMTMSGGSFAAARFGAGLRLNGAQKNHIMLKNNIKILGGAAGCTFSAWINPTNLENNVNGVVIMTLGKWFTNNHNSYADFNVNAIGQMISHIDSGPNTGGSGYQRINSIAGIVKPSEWTWVTYVIDLAAAEERFFKNGQLVDTKKPPGGAFASRTFIDMVSSRVVIGTEEDNVAHWYTGDMDELRIETEMRTPAWISAQYRAMTAPGFVKVELDR